MEKIITYQTNGKITSVQGAIPHIPFLDGIRACAALYVLIHHSVLQIHDREASVFISKIGFLFEHGRYAVDVFIVVSGFCLMLPVITNQGRLKGGILFFFQRRARRILPTYYFAMAFSLLLIFTIIGDKTYTHWDVSIPVSAWDLFTHTFLLQDLFYDSHAKINHVFWSISVEWRIYFLFPVILFAWRKLGPGVSTICTILFSTAGWYLLTQTNLNFYTMSINYIGLFSLGMYAAQKSYPNANIKSHVNLNYTLAFVATTLFLIMLFCVPTIEKKLSPLYTDLLLGIWSSCLLFLLATGKYNWLIKIFSSKVLAFIGMFAYSIYLIHAPLLQVISKFVIIPMQLSPNYSLVVFILFGLPLIVGFSYLFYLLCERPFIKFRKKDHVKNQQKVFTTEKVSLP